MEHQKRGKNYTSEDRSLFLSLLETKKNVIECKISNRVSLEAKKEAWLDITRKFNASSTVNRTMRQLKTFYENIKRKTKKEVAAENKEKYKTFLGVGLEPPQTLPLEQLDEVGEVQMQDLRNRANQEKKEIQRTGGGRFNTTLTEEDYRVLSLLGDNIRPLENPFDDANIYFAHPTPFIEEVSPEPPQVPSPPISSIQDDPTPQEGSSSLPLSDRPPRIIKKRKIKKNIIKKSNLTPKDRYYLQKLANAKIEGQILKLQLRRLQQQS